MGFEKGGTAAKLGDRYEGRWVVHQLLLLLAERVRSVQLEAIGDAEHGVDLWVSRSDGIREAQQCKAFNRSKGNWSIPDLSSRDVLKRAYEQLTANHRDEFCFVSSVPATDLEDLSRSARDSGGSVEPFYEHYVIGKLREKPFRALCKSLNLDSQSSEARAHAFDFLLRIHSHTFQDDRPTRDHLEFMASLVLTGGTPAAAVGSLADIAQENLHQELNAPRVVQLLEPYGLRLRSCSADPSITARLEELRETFVQSIEAQLAAGKLIPRTEADEVVALLSGQSKPDAVVIHGGAGYGKSGALYQLAMALRAKGVLVLAVRLDRKPPTALNSVDYGHQLGLPGSPVATLSDLAAGQPAVLILDQLDALRWTNSHSAQGLDVCKSLIREVQAARSLGARIDVVLACRTFDLERDPEIRSWLSDSNSSVRIAKIEVKPLSENLVNTLIQAEGIEPATLGAKQVQLLQSVQRLAMWIEIVRSEATSPIFDSSTQLMRRFWENRRMKLEQSGCDPSNRDQVVAGLVDYMEAHACLSAPERLLGNDQKLKTELQSCGVINIRERTVSFGHQANLDFLVAERAVSKMAAQGLDVLQWVGPRDQQSLFRREQLRQLLFLLADEDHANFLASIKLLLDAEAARFHLRQLALETLGQVQPQSDTFDFVLDLLDHEQWREHIQLHVIHGNESYISHLFRRGDLMQMLAASDSDIWRQAATWLWSLRRKSPAFVVSVCRCIIGEVEDWLPRVSRALGHDGIEVEIDELFSLRLEWLRRGSEAHYVNWDEFGKTHPQRAIQLYDAMLCGWAVRGATRSDRRDEMHLYGGRERKALARAARRYPGLAWKLLWPRLNWFVAENGRRRREWRRQHAGSKYMPRDARIVVPASLQKIVAAAGRRLARRSPNAMLRIASAPNVRRSRILAALFGALLADAPTSFADQSLLWLLDDLRRLHCGNGKRLPRWNAAAKLIRRMSPHCSESVYRSLELVLLQFRDPEEKKSAEYWLRATRDGYFMNGFGAGQYHLLPALDARRRSVDTIGRIGVLSCKFAAYSPEFFLSRGGVGRAGWVQSPIDQEGRLERMSDKAWLRLVASKAVANYRGRWRHARGRSGFLESSVEMLSRSFGRAALLEPERFARLGLAFSADAHPSYVAALLSALARTKAPNEVPETKRDDWRPASGDSTLRLLSTIRLCDSPDVAKSFCWIVRDRSDVPITDVIVERLMHYGQHSQPEPEELIIDCDSRASECGVNTLEDNALNTVRSLVALAIESILWRRIELLPKLESTVDALLNDSHPAVRLAAIHVCLPVWKKDRSKGIRWLVLGVANDSRIAASRAAHQLYDYAFTEFSQELVPVVRAMVHSQRDDVAEAGASQVTARWLFHGLFDDELRECVNGSIPQRKAVADVAVQLAFDDDLTRQCLHLIQRYLNDEAKEVRQTVSHIVYSDKFFDAPWAAKFLTAYVKSKSFEDDDSHLLWKLKDLSGPIDRFSDAIFGITDLVVQAARGMRDSTERHWDVDSLVILLLRLYERASGAGQNAVRQGCLDAWDELLKSRAALAWSLTRGLNEVQV